MGKRYSLWALINDLVMNVYVLVGHDFSMTACINHEFVAVKPTGLFQCSQSQNTALTSKL